MPQKGRLAVLVVSYAGFKVERGVDPTVCCPIYISE